MMKKILIVDDDRTIRELYRYILTEAGYAAETAEDGGAAITRLATYTPDCMIIDISMPGMDGAEFIEALNAPAARPELKGIPFVIMTGETLDAVAHKNLAGNASCKAFIPKMTDPDMVTQTIRGILACG